MKPIVVVGSGPSGVHFSLSVLKKGYEVVMLDVGIAKPPVLRPDDSFSELKQNLVDPIEYFLGGRFESVIYPSSKGEYYGFPPNKQYVFSKPKQFDVYAQGLTPLNSFAQGGLAEAWTAGVYPFREEELIDFPFVYQDIRPHYDEISARIGISGARDDLSQFFPMPKYVMNPLELDENSQNLLDKYAAKKQIINDQLGCFMGRARLAVLSRDQDARKACSYRGRCLWGCPSSAFYTPSLTLEQCKQYDTFQYVPGSFVTHFKVGPDKKITHICTESLETNESQSYPVGTLVLASGTFSTSRIVLDSIRIHTGKILELSGLMDNQQILVPFVNVKLIGGSLTNERYQYNQLALGMEGDHPKEYVHALITTLKASLFHPLIQRIPVDLRTAMFIFRQIHPALGLVNVNLHDTRRADNTVTIEPLPGKISSKLLINYVVDRGQDLKIQNAIHRIKKVLWQLGCLVPPGMVHIRPMGASVHYAGTIPMSDEKRPLTVSKNCQSHDFENLYVVDGTTFPFLPAKNITFSLMANAVRVAEAAF